MMRRRKGGAAPEAVNGLPLSPGNGDGAPISDNDMSRGTGEKRSEGVKGLALEAFRVVDRG